MRSVSDLGWVRSGRVVGPVAVAFASACPTSTDANPDSGHVPTTAMRDAGPDAASARPSRGAGGIGGAVEEGGLGGMGSSGGTDGTAGSAGAPDRGGGGGAGGMSALDGGSGAGGTGGMPAPDAGSGTGGTGGMGTGGSSGSDAGAPGCDSAWLATPPKWFGTAGADDWRPELHDPRWANAPLTEFAATPGGTDSVAGLFRMLVQGNTLYLAYEAPAATSITFNDYVYFAITRGTGGLGAFALRVSPDQTTAPVAAPAASVPKDPTLPVATDPGYVDWFATTNATLSPPTWTSHPAEIPVWVSDLATWRGSPGAGWAVTFKIDLTQLGAAGTSLRMFYGMSVEQGAPASTVTLATPVIAAPAGSVDGDTIIPVSPGDTCDDSDPDTLLNNPCWRDVSLAAPGPAIAISSSDIGIFQASSLTDQIQTCGSSAAPCPTDGSSVTNAFRVIVHGVPSTGITAHAVRAQIRVSAAASAGAANAPWTFITPFAPDAIFVAEQRALTSDPAWSWSYDSGTGDAATLEYTCNAAANDYCPKLAGSAAKHQCLLVELGSAPAIGTGFSSFSAASAARDIRLLP